MGTSRKIVEQCCVCKRIRSGSGTYHSVRALPVHAEVRPVYCPRCHRVAREDMETGMRRLGLKFSL